MHAAEKKCALRQTEMDLAVHSRMPFCANISLLYKHTRGAAKIEEFCGSHIADLHSRDIINH